MLKSFPLRLIFSGAVVWLAPFILAIPLFALIGDSNGRILFRVVMSLVITATGTLAWLGFNGRQAAPVMKTAVAVGFFWIFSSVIPDLIVYKYAFKMGFHQYLSEIAPAYLAYPIITVTSTWLVRRVCCIGGAGRDPEPKHE